MNLIYKNADYGFDFKSYLALPSNKSFVDGHCLIIPMQHYISSLMIDENVWDEMNARIFYFFNLIERISFCFYLDVQKGDC